MDIRNEIRQLLQEALTTEHYMERLYNRFLNKNSVTVGFEIQGTIGKYQIVGSYQVSKYLKQEVLNTVQFLEHFGFSRTRSFAVKIVDILIDPEKVIYLNSALRQNPQRANVFQPLD